MVIGKSEADMIERISGRDHFSQSRKSAQQSDRVQPQDEEDQEISIRKQA
jgi:hypothetical protein